MLTSLRQASLIQLRSYLTYSVPGFPGGSDRRESACNAGSSGFKSWVGRPGFKSWVGQIPLEETWQSTPVFLPGENPWTEEPGGLQSTGSKSIGHDWATKHSTAQLFSPLFEAEREADPAFLAVDAFLELLANSQPRHLLYMLNFQMNRSNKSNMNSTVKL